MVVLDSTLAQATDSWYRDRGVGHLNNDCPRPPLVRVLHRPRIRGGSIHKPSSAEQAAIMKLTKGDYEITDERTRVDIDFVERMLRQSYWAPTRTRRRIQQSIAHSLCFSVIQEETQVGFARVVTDEYTFAWIADVVIDADHRGRGLGKWLMEVVLAHPKVRDTSQQLLRTDDAHALYERYGFERSECLSRRVET